MVTVLVFSPVHLFCEGLAACVTASLGDARILGTPCSLELLYATLEATLPELLLYDVTRQELLIEARRIIVRWPELPVIAVALPEEPVDVVRCAEAGFVGYVPAHASTADLAAIIRASVAGEVICSPRVAAELMREIRQRPRPGDPEKEPLSRRECEILALVARGLCNKEIARELNLSIATVKNHVHNIFGKLKVSDRRAAIALLRSNPSLLSAA